MNDQMQKCREARDAGRAFVVGDECWMDPQSKEIQREHSWADEKWIIGRGPEWIVREVTAHGVYASYKPEHAPTFFGVTALIPSSITAKDPHGWVSVEDRMPEVGQDVEAWTDIGTRVLIQWHSGRKHVTHWRIPTPGPSEGGAS